MLIFSGEQNGKMNGVAAVPDKQLDLFVQTVYTNVKMGTSIRGACIHFLRLGLMAAEQCTQ